MLFRMAPDGSKAEEMALLDLGNEGIRELVAVPEGILVLSGPLDDNAAAHHLWLLPAPGAMARRLPIELPPHTEAIAIRGTSLLWTTDGDGKPGACKKPSTWGVERMPSLR
jgi:hypothetical protein